MPKGTPGGIEEEGGGGGITSVLSESIEGYKVKRGKVTPSAATVSFETPMLQRKKQFVLALNVVMGRSKPNFHPHMVLTGMERMPCF
jgi:hypothetical protein